MKYQLIKKSISLLCLLLPFFWAVAQSEAVTPVGSLNIMKEVKPPILEITETVAFVEQSGNNAIDANESCKIVLKVKNSGLGDGIGLTAKISATGTTSGLSFNNFSLPTLKVGETQTVEFPIASNMNTMDGTVEFIVEIDEPNGFGTDKQTITVNIKKFVSPMLEIVDYSITGSQAGVLTKKKPFDLQVLLQNTQHGVADNVNAAIVIPNGVFLISGNEEVHFASMKAGETQSIVYQMIVSDNFTKDIIPIKITLSEKHGKFAQNKDITLTINQQLAAAKIEVKPVIETAPDAIVIGSLTSDVDKNIPSSNSKNPYRFALIFGNEDYHSYQRGLNAESDVAYAVNDATVFKNYCINALGVEEQNVVFHSNATAAVMSQEIEKICKLMKIKGSASELIFYYAGHGFPDENTKDPYIIPVDVSAANLTEGIKLYDLYAKLSQTGAGKITVFMDACFSGGARQSGLLAVRGVKIKPKQDALSGNIVVFAATKEDQSALPYPDKQHGMFTYFLLKKLQMNEHCSYSELFDYLHRQVSEYSLRIHSKDQNPETNVAPNVSEIWKSWKF